MGPCSEKHSEVWDHRYQSLAVCFVSKWAGCMRSSPGTCLSLFQSKGQNLQRKKFPSWQKNPNQPPHHPEKREGRSPKGKWLCRTDPGGKQVCGQIRGACEERWCCFTRGLDHQRRHSTEGSGLCGSLVSFFRAALFRGTQGGCHFLFQSFCTHTM